MNYPEYPCQKQGEGAKAEVGTSAAQPKTSSGKEHLPDKDQPGGSLGPDRFKKSMPLRVWLILVIVVVSGIGLAASSIAVNSLMREVMYSRVDQDLVNSIGGWARNSEIFDADRSPRPPTDFVVIKRFADGSRIIFNDPGQLPDLDNIEEGLPTTVGSVLSSTNTDDSATATAHWRVVALTEGDVTTVVAKNLDQERALLLGLGFFQLVISGVVLFVMAILGYFFIRRALAPLREVEKTAAHIAAGDLDRRVPQWSMNTEVGQLAFALNTMLGQLQRSVETSLEKEAQMRRFVGDASHELRTPLTSVRGYTELYRSGATDNVDMVLTKIDDESKRMSLLVEDLLALTRAEGSRLEKKPVDLLELSLSVATSARAAFPGRKISVQNQTSSIPVVSGDPSRLHQVMLNLISNGFHHGGPEAKVTITLRLDEGKDHVLLAIADDGRGMSKEVASHIFERFYREDSSRSRASGGSGLGLAITKSLVEQHAGTIAVDSTPGQGSTFLVCLPLVAV